jgi:hypothetical protein
MGDWLPHSRDALLHVCDAWEAQLTQNGAAWGVPPGKITEFKNQEAAARTLFTEVRSGSRTPVNTEQCRVLFHELEQAMRFLKNNFFNSPPRTSSEMAALLLHVHDGVLTPILPSGVIPGLSLHNTDGHGMLVKLFTDAEPEDRRSADHFFVKWGLKPRERWATAEEAAQDPRLLVRLPVRAEDLPMHFSTSRGKNDLPFTLADIGMELFATACWQTPRNQEGPYCPILSRIIA